MRSRLICIGALVLASCAATPQPRPADTDDDTASAPVEEPPPPQSLSDNPVESVPLKVVITDQTTTGRVIQMRGKIANPHAEDVEGVRLQLVFLSPDGTGNARVLEIQQKEVGSTLKPGASTMMSWDVESMYSESGHFMVFAYPKRLGGKDMPPPDNWKD